jgi:hypothetical protein
MPYYDGAGPLGRAGSPVGGPVIHNHDEIDADDLADGVNGRRDPRDLVLRRNHTRDSTLLLDRRLIIPGHSTAA